MPDRVEELLSLGVAGVSDSPRSPGTNLGFAATQFGLANTTIEDLETGETSTLADLPEDAPFKTFRKINPQSQDPPSTSTFTFAKTLADKRSNIDQLLEIEPDPDLLEDPSGFDVATEALFKRPLAGAADLGLGLVESTGLITRVGKKIAAEAEVLVNNALQDPEVAGRNLGKDAEQIIKSVFEVDDVGNIDETAYEGFVYAITNRARQELRDTQDPRLDESAFVKLGTGLGNALGFVGLTALTGGSGFAVMGAGSAVEINALFREAKALGADDTTALLTSMFGIPSGAIERLPALSFWRRFNRAANGKLTQGVVAGLGQMTGQAFNEGVEETLQSSIGSAAMSIAGLKEWDLLNDLYAAGEEGIYGGGVGAILGFFGVAGGRKRRVYLERATALASEHTGLDLDYRVRDDGRVELFDKTDGKVVRPSKDGDKLAFEKEGDVVEKSFPIDVGNGVQLPMTSTQMLELSLLDPKADEATRANVARILGVDKDALNGADFGNLSSLPGRIALVELAKKQTEGVIDGQDQEQDSGAGEVQDQEVEVVEPEEKEDGEASEVGGVALFASDLSTDPTPLGEDEAPASAIVEDIEGVPHVRLVDIDQFLQPGRNTENPEEFEREAKALRAEALELDIPRLSGKRITEIARAVQEQRGADQLAIENVPPEMRPLNPRASIRLERPKTEVAKQIEQAMARAGGEVVFVSTNDPQGIASAGLFDHSTPNRIYVAVPEADLAVDPDRYLASVALHEFTHFMRKNNPELYTEFVAELQKLDQAGFDLARQAYLDNVASSGDVAQVARLKKDQDKLNEEAAATYVGDARRFSVFGDPTKAGIDPAALLRRIASDNPTGFRKLLDTVERWLERLSGAQERIGRKFSDLAKRVRVGAKPGTGQSQSPRARRLKRDSRGRIVTTRSGGLVFEDVPGGKLSPSDVIGDVIPADIKKRFLSGELSPREAAEQTVERRTGGRSRPSPIGVTKNQLIGGLERFLSGIDTKQFPRPNRDRANPGFTEETATLGQVVDEIRAEQGKPEEVKDQEAIAAGEAMVKRLGDAKTAERIIKRSERGGQLDHAETVAAKIVITRMADKAFSGDAGAFEVVTKLVNSYRDLGAEQARAFRLRRDRNESPSERAKRIITEMTFTMSPKMKTQLDSARRDGDKAREKRIMDRFNRDIEKRKKKLQALGIGNLENLKDIIRDQLTAAEFINAYQTTMEWSLPGVLLEYYRNALLSGLKTQTTNILSNAAYSTNLIFFERFLGSFVSLIPGLKKKDLDSATIGEFAHVLTGFWPGMKQGVLNAALSWRTELPYFEQSIGREGRDKLDTFRRSINIPSFKVDRGPGKVPLQIGGRQIRWPQRFLLAMDEFFKTVVANMEVGAQAYRIATNDGLRGEARGKAIREMQLDLGSRAWENAARVAVESTFQERLSSDLRKTDIVSPDVFDVFADGAIRIVTGAKKIPVLDIITTLFFPFITAPTNIFKQGLKRAPGIAAIPMLQRLKRGIFQNDWRGLNRSMVHNIQSLMLYMLILSMNDREDEEPVIVGSMTASAFRDRAKRLQQFRTFEPMSVINPFGTRNKDGFMPRVSFSRLEPLAVSAGLTADLIESWRQGKPPSGKLLDLLNSNIGQLHEKTFLRSMSDMVGLIADPENNGERWLAGFGSAWVPNILKQVGRAGQGTLKERRIWDSPSENTKWVNRMFQSIELGAGSQEYPKIDNWGRDIERVPGGADRNPGYGASDDFWYETFVPFTRFKTEIAKGDRVLINYNKNVPDEEERFFNEPRRRFKDLSGKDVGMTEDQVARYFRQAGKTADLLIQKMNLRIKGPDVDIMDADGVKEAVRRARTASLEQLKAFEWLKFSEGKVDTPEVMADKLWDSWKISMVKSIGKPLLKGTETKPPETEADRQFDAQKFAHWSGMSFKEANRLLVRQFKTTDARLRASGHLRKWWPKK
jgi:hypothetical protein